MADAFLKERQIADCGIFGVFWYRRPTGHTKTGARHHGETPVIVEWAVVHKAEYAPGSWGWAVGQATPGFPSRAAAEAAGRGKR